MFLSGLTEQTTSEITHPFTMVSKRINGLGINLRKEVQSLFSTNYKALLKEIKRGSKQIEKHPLIMDEET